MVLIVFGLEGGLILKNPLLAIKAVVIMLNFYLIISGITILSGILLRMKYEDIVVLTFGSASKKYE